MVWYQCTCVMNYVDQQTLKPVDDYIPPHQRLCMCLSTVSNGAFPAAAAHLWNSLPSPSLLTCLSPSFAVILNHISSRFFIPLSDSSLICTVPEQWLVSLDLLSLLHLIFIIYLLRCFAICWNCLGWGSSISVSAVKSSVVVLVLRCT